MKLRTLLFAVLLLLVPSIVSAQVITSTGVWPITNSTNFTVIKYVLTTAGDGSFPKQATTTNVNGAITRVVVIPGSPAPTNGSKLYITDLFNANVVGGYITVSNTATIDVTPQLFTVTGAYTPGDKVVYAPLRFELTDNTTANAQITIRVISYRSNP